MSRDSVSAWKTVAAKAFEWFMQGLGIGLGLAIALPVAETVRALIEAML